MTKTRLLQLERARRASDVPELVAEIRRLCVIIKDQRKELAEVPELTRQYRKTWWTLEHYAVPKTDSDRGTVEAARGLGRRKFTEDGSRR